MATAATHRALSARLESEVSRHGCASINCPLCADREECIAVAPTQPVVRREAVRAVEMADSLEIVFGRELNDY